MGCRGLGGRIAVRAARAGVGVDESVVDALVVYVELLRRWNRRTNLTGLTEDDKGLDRLIVEPLVAAGRLRAGAGSMVDIGSGGGSPAVPMRLAVPGLRVRMVESKTKKGVFLREVVRELDLEHVVVETCRYEELVRRRELHGVADVVTVRAVRVDGRALQSLEALLKVGGRLFLFRGTGEAEVPGELRPPLRWQGTYPLVESLCSRLVVLEKMGVSEQKA